MCVCVCVCVRVCVCVCVCTGTGELHHVLISVPLCLAQILQSQCPSIFHYMKLLDRGLFRICAWVRDPRDEARDEARDVGREPSSAMPVWV